MTRINLIPVNKLTDKHLVAEYREMLRLRHLHPRKTMPDIPSYRLGKGHVLFFADKGLWLLKRHKQLCQEMRKREFTTNYSLDLSSWPNEAMNGWQPTEYEIGLSLERIKERLG